MFCRTCFQEPMCVCIILPWPWKLSILRYIINLITFYWKQVFKIQHIMHYFKSSILFSPDNVINCFESSIAITTSRVMYVMLFIIEACDHHFFISCRKENIILMYTEKNQGFSAFPMSLNLFQVFSYLEYLLSLGHQPELLKIDLRPE